MLKFQVIFLFFSTFFATLQKTNVSKNHIFSFCIKSMDRVPPCPYTVTPPRVIRHEKFLFHHLCILDIYKSGGMWYNIEAPEERSPAVLLLPLAQLSSHFAEYQPYDIGARVRSRMCFCFSSGKSPVYRPENFAGQGKSPDKSLTEPAGMCYNTLYIPLPVCKEKKRSKP